MILSNSEKIKRAARGKKVIRIVSSKGGINQSHSRKINKNHM